MEPVLGCEIDVPHSWSEVIRYRMYVYRVYHCTVSWDSRSEDWTVKVMTDVRESIYMHIYVCTILGIISHD